MFENKLQIEKISKLFKKFGVKSITMDDISNELGISKKTLYQIVSDKNELVEIIFDFEFNYFKNKLDGILNTSCDAIQQLININILLHEFLSILSKTEKYDLEKYHSEIYKKVYDNYFNLFLPCIRANLIKGKQEGHFRIELNEEIISKLLLSRIEQVANSEIFSLEEYTSAEFVKEICHYHLRGVVNKDGERLLTKYKTEIENIK